MPSSGMPPPNRFFQSAVRDPSLPRHQQKSFFSNTVPAAVVPNHMLNIMVGPDSNAQRIWTLSKALVSKHSSYLALKCSGSTITLSCVTPPAFANFVDYMHSSIYSVNSHVPDFRPLRADIEACALGMRLGAKEYVIAAASHLHTTFEPLALQPTSNRKSSMITAQDISFLCSALQGFTVPGYGLRIMFYDAVASHWNQNEVQNIGDLEGWQFLNTTNMEFRTRLMSSAPIKDSTRANLFMPVQTYLKLIM